MATITETSVAAATESETKVEDQNIDEVTKAAKLAALKGDCDETSEAKEETQEPQESSTTSHSNGSANGVHEKNVENGVEVSKHTSPNKDAATDNSGETKSDDAKETEEVPSSEAAQDSAETPKVEDAKDTDSPKEEVAQS